MLFSSQDPYSYAHPRSYSGITQQDEAQSSEKGALLINADHLKTNEEYTHSKTRKPRRFEQFRQSWKLSILYWATLCTVTLLINISLTLVVGATRGFQSGLGTLTTGNCGRVKNYNTGLHVVINVLSTAILAGSNFCMQCLSAPTRKEVDGAHAEGVSLDIGVPSLRNFRYIGVKKFVMWLLFALSSTPLHLFFNSVIYSSLTHHNYSIVLGTDQFFNAPSLPDRVKITPVHQDVSNDRKLRTQDVAYGDCEYPYIGTPEEYTNCIASVQAARSKGLSLLRDQFREGKLQRLTTQKCIRTYAQDFLTEYGNLILVPTESRTNKTIVTAIWPYQSTNSRGTVFDEWMCAFTPSIGDIALCQTALDQLISDPQTNFRPWNQEIDHCLVQQVESQCNLHFNLPIAIVVIVVNAMKIVLMLLSTRYLDTFPLLTIGDALESFITEQDGRTKGNCLYRASDFKQQSGTEYLRPLFWKNVRYRWFRAPGRKRWIQFLVPWFLIFSVVCGLTIYGFFRLGNNFPNRTFALRLGLGAIKSSTILYVDLPNYGPNALIRNVLVANSPQLILSIIYFTLNALITSMTTGLEWAKMALHRKGLRVSKNPFGEQRQTYFLQLPYRYSVPLLVMSGVMHWLVSQAIFVVTLTQQTLELSGEINQTSQFYPGESQERTYYDCGWSPLACTLAIVISFTMFLGLAGLSLRKYPTGMPLGANNSLVLAAACHIELHEKNDNIAHKKLKWGVTSGTDVQNPVGHCALSSRHVEYPVVGTSYL